MRKLFFQGISFLSILLFLMACKKEKLTNSTPELVNYNIPQEFSHWFKKRFDNNQIIINDLNNTITNPINKIILEPVWSEAKNYKRGDSLITEVPLINGNIVFSKNSIDPKSYDYSKSGSLTSLLFIKTDSIVRGVLMTIIGDEKYLGNNMQKLKNNSFRAKENDFSGDVLYHTTNGSFINGFRYFNGVVVGIISQAETPNLNEKKKFKINTTKDFLCETFKQVSTYRQCSGGCIYWSETIYFQNCYFSGGPSDIGPSGCGGSAKDLLQSVDWTPCNDMDVVEEKPVRGLAYKINIHKLIMRNAAEKTGICPSAISILEKGVEWTDYNTIFGLAEGSSIYHFDGLSDYNNIQKNWSLMRDNLNKNLSNSNYFPVGVYLHAFQDFYAHSNYGSLLIKYYKNDKNLIPFSEVLKNTSGKYDRLIEFLRENGLKTGTFDIITFSLGRPGAEIIGVNYEDTHSFIADDKVESYAGKYAARLAELETFNVLVNMNKCN